MDKIPAWLKALAVAFAFAVLYGGARLLLYLDKTASGKVGLD